MPWVDELSSALQGALKQTVTGPFKVEAIIDPDGEALDISAYIDRDAPLTVRKSKAVMPGRAGRFTVGEVRLTLKNKDDYFNPENSASPFYHPVSRLYADALATDTAVDVPKGDGALFTAGQKITLGREDAAVTATVSAIDGSSYSAYDRITLTAATGAVLTAGDPIEGYYYAGKKVTLKTVIDGVSDKVEQFSGYLKDLPTVYADKATVVLQDRFKTLLETPLKANTLLWLTDSIGGYERTLSYKKNDGGTSYSEQGKDAYVFNVSGVTTAPAERVQYKNNDSHFEVQSTDIQNGIGTITTVRVLGVNEPDASGTLTKISNPWTTGDASISYNSYTREGRLDDDAITIDSGRCVIGDWDVVFRGATEFTAYDPENNAYEGTTTASFYAGTASAYMLTIPASAWKGSFERGDKVSFKTGCALGQPVNSYDTIPKMLYRLLSESFGAGVAAADIDSTAFNTLISDYDEMRGAITFQRATSVLKALEILQGHINATVFLKNDNVFSVSAYRPQKTPATVYTLSPAADIMDVSYEIRGRISKVYAEYDSDGSGYAGSILAPSSAPVGGDAVHMRFPAYRNSDRAQARAAAERLWLMWRRDLKSYRVKEKWNYGLALDVNEVYSISSSHPALGGRNVEIYEIEKDLRRCTVVFKALDFSLVFGKYAWYDQDNYDQDKVYW